jgi:DNA-binding CsgD family transcriptional regulator
MLQALGSADLRGALDALGAIAEGTAADGAFARHGLASLPRLVPSELATLSFCDLDTRHRRVTSDVPGAISARESAAFDRHFHAHPLLRAHGRNPQASTRRMSDLVRAQDFRRSALYNEYYRPIRIEHAVAVPIHEQRGVLVGFVLNRSGRDFSDRDRDCLEAIRPHLGTLYRLTIGAEGPRAAWGVPSCISPGRTERLTPREREVLQWLSGGKTDRDIACILGISPRTVHKHLQRVYEKLGVETRTAAVTRAMGHTQR